jgi:zinc/manganese transport system ATP-binding protein
MIFCNNLDHPLPNPPPLRGRETRPNLLLNILQLPLNMVSIELKKVTLAFGARKILTDFNASIARGEFIGIFGPNGAGKSTFLRAILGLLKPLAGEIFLNGRPVYQGNAVIGYMPQSHHVMPQGKLSGRARLAACSFGTKWGLPVLNKKQRTEINWAIKMVEAEDYVDRPIVELSGGERQRLLLAQALIGQPEFLLLDEPLSNLDPNHQEKLVQLVQHIRKQLNATILFTAHDLNPLISVMDRIIYLAQGNAAIGTVNEIVTSEKLTWLYKMPIEVLHHQERLFVITQKTGSAEFDSHH